MNQPLLLLRYLALGVVVAAGGCSRGAIRPAADENKPANSAQTAAANPPKQAKPVTQPPLQVDGARALNFVRQMVAFGPRPIGSEAHRKVEAYLRAHLQGKASEVEEDEFNAQTPAGTFRMRNFIAKFQGTRDGVVIVGSHYDTLYSLKNFVGANDGGSTTGLLLEIANQLAGHKLSGYSVWLVFLDGEEAVKQWTDTDSVYGSRHLAQKWQADGTIKKLKAFILTDMIGDADLNIDRDANSTPWMEDLVYQAATDLGYQSHFFGRTGGFQDDHIPFVRAGVPCADLIDLSYGYNNVFWHTPQDTVDKLSPTSLQITGDVVLRTVDLLNQK